MNLYSQWSCERACGIISQSVRNRVEANRATSLDMIRHQQMAHIPFLARLSQGDSFQWSSEVLPAAWVQPSDFERTVPSQQGDFIPVSHARHRPPHTTPLGSTGTESSPMLEDVIALLVDMRELGYTGSDVHQQSLFRPGQNQERQVICSFHQKRYSGRGGTN